MHLLGKFEYLKILNCECSLGLLWPTQHVDFRPGLAQPVWLSQFLGRQRAAWLVHLSASHTQRSPYRSDAIVPAGSTLMMMKISWHACILYSIKFTASDKNLYLMTPQADVVIVVSCTDHWQMIDWKCRHFNMLFSLIWRHFKCNCTDIFDRWKFTKQDPYLNDFLCAADALFWRDFIYKHVNRPTYLSKRVENLKRLDGYVTSVVLNWDRIRQLNM